MTPPIGTAPFPSDLHRHAAAAFGRGLLWLWTRCMEGMEMVWRFVEGERR